MADRWAVAVWASALTLACGFMAAPAVAVTVLVALLPEMATALDAGRGLVGAAADGVAASLPVSLLLAPALTWAAVALDRGWLAWTGFAVLVAHAGTLLAIISLPAVL